MVVAKWDVEKQRYVYHMMFLYSPTTSSFIMFAKDLLAFSLSNAAQPMRWEAMVGHGICCVINPQPGATHREREGKRERGEKVSEIEQVVFSQRDVLHGRLELGACGEIRMEC